MKRLNYNDPSQDAGYSSTMAAEAVAAYVKNSQQEPVLFSMSAFLELDHLLPLSQAEWAEVLHISDRTLQRYIKDEKPFEGLYAEHLMQIQLLAQKSAAIFASPATFKEWLMHPKNILGNELGFSSLKSFWGVKLLLNELGRIEHGVYV
ncbi:type II RES/Xre toxin-antitoxin system antitoxin [Olivibacter sitiensis]|uniref:type II RES/Xre toxin-antitoxin system antitoxin n=1 Tax=Olivibacter sitiensis TaxID=376470 RepID=UPI0012FA4007|nr:antitoxin Xre-like helix-turn-helix domain-containing protein [Olivibacter sitiensis]